MLLEFLTNSAIAGSFTTGNTATCVLLDDHAWSRFDYVHCSGEDSFLAQVCNPYKTSVLMSIISRLLYQDDYLYASCVKVFFRKQLCLITLEIIFCDDSLYEDQWI